MSLLATMAKTYGKDRVSREKLKRIQERRLKKLVAYTSKYSPDRKSTRLNSSHPTTSRMPSSA